MNLSGASSKGVIVRHFGLRDYPDVWQDMQHFTDTRTPDTRDEIWLLEHSPVFTLGLNSKPEHVLTASDIPVVKCDRGGQVTYHGPGQLIVYLLLDLRRRKLGVKKLVHKIEQAIINLLEDNGIHSQRRAGAPGIYVDDAKIAALGLRIRRGCCYHGLSLNVNMDLLPFSHINPCGYAGLKIVQLHDLRPDINLEHIGDALLQQLARQLAAG